MANENLQPQNDPQKGGHQQQGNPRPDHRVAATASRGQQQQDPNRRDQQGGQNR